jgi:propanol-preferring alcohol dehydrogenase
MRAMVLEQVGAPLRWEDVEEPRPGPGQVRLRVHCNAVCRTDLHIVDGDLPLPRLPLIPGHQIVGVVDALGEHVTSLAVGDRVGVPWLGWTCGACRWCRAGRENLCDAAAFTGLHRDGGYAEACLADERFAFSLPSGWADAATAPLLCAGLIGYRALRMAGDPATLGLYGFGAAAHIVCQVATWEGRRVFAFTRPGDDGGQAFARSMGATWAGGSDEPPPEPLDAAIVFAPDGSVVPLALRGVNKAGIVVCGGIHMSDIPSFPYASLWKERVLRSVANLTRRDAVDFLAIAPRVPIRTTVIAFPLAQANQVLADLRAGRVEGAAVLVV